MTSSETTFNDEELIARLRDSVSGEHDMTPHGADVLQAADRIEELIEESGRRLALARSEGVARVEQFERTEALTEQLAAARQDAKEAEAYAEGLEKERDAIDAKLAQAVKLIDLAVELARWDRAPKLRDDMIDFTTEIKGEIP